MSNAKTDPREYDYCAPPAITVHALSANKKPIGFAPWPKEPKKKRKRKQK